MRRELEYGAGGVVGVLTPQANTTVEPELGVLLPPDTNVLVARLQSSNEALADRLRDYLNTVATAVSQFGTVRFDVLCFACTGSCYVIGAERETQLLEAAAGGECKVISAASAVEDALRAIDARRIGIVSPYPRWLTDSGSRFWAGRGFEVREVVQIHGDDASPDIYGLRTGRVDAALRTVREHELDAVLLAGTGMPTLSTLVKAQRQPESGLVLSPNVCMSWCV
ncbi:MAG TPA: hypothetical protein VJ011_07230, partial [Steroidobacteraceae bacterium]|nr:hypothetical protein [Steroidobacteraceae bacterium]